MLTGLGQLVNSRCVAEVAVSADAGMSFGVRFPAPKRPEGSRMPQAHLYNSMHLFGQRLAKMRQSDEVLDSGGAFWTLLHCGGSRGS